MMKAIGSLLSVAASAVLMQVSVSPRSMDSCAVAATSRWSTGAGEYHRAHVFGDGETWLEALTGIAADEAGVVLYDGAAARVHVLTSDLQVRHSFGRAGKGPGELAVPLMTRFDNRQEFRANYLAMSDSVVYVFDGAHIHAFGRDGVYRDRVASSGSRIRTFSIFALQSTPAGLLFAYDSADISGTRRRSLQTWRADGQSGPVLVHAHPLGVLPGTRGSFSTWSRDPRPLWAATSSCVFWSDGHSRTLYRLDTGSERIDTMRLPEHRVPPDDYDADTHGRLAERMGAQPPARRPRNAPLIRWSAMSVDPDGHLWIKPWYTGQRLAGPVYRMDPAGRVHRERVPAFPIAFGPPGTFYAREVDAGTDEVRVVRYELRSR
jgi:hypothetical protein